jgi:CubicO group peptidase (beta-lactamase class C family)
MKRTLVFIPLSMMTVVGLWTLTTFPRTAHPGHSLGIETYPSARDLYAFTEALRIKYQLPALGVGMIHRGKIVGLGMAGERIIRSGNWATLDDAFDVASCTKSITATIAAMLVEEKKVRWDTTLAEAFPELKSSMQPSYMAVTLEQLLRHRSGLGRIMDRNDRWTAWHREHRNESPREQRRRLVANALRQPPRFAAGTDEYYTNDGYLIVGSLLEQAAEMDWEILVPTRIFQPLELKSMRHGVGPGSIEAQVWGHEAGLVRTRARDCSRPGRIRQSAFRVTRRFSPRHGARSFALYRLSYSRRKRRASVAVASGFPAFARPSRKTGRFFPRMAGGRGARSGGARAVAKRLPWRLLGTRPC